MAFTDRLHNDVGVGDIVAYPIGRRELGIGTILRIVKYAVIKPLGPGSNALKPPSCVVKLNPELVALFRLGGNR